MEEKERTSPEVKVIFAFIAATRLLAPLWFTPWYSEFTRFHYSFAALSDWGLYPFVHYWLEYPPLFPYLSLGVYKLCAVVLPAQAPAHLHAYALILQGIMGIADVGNAFLIFRLVARRHGAHAGLYAAIAFSLSFTAVFTCSGFFDGSVLFFILLGVHSLLQNRPLSAGVALGLGAAMKIYPVAILPALWKYRNMWKGFSRSLAGFFIPLLLFWGSFFIISPELAIMPIRVNSVRQPWQTVWAVIEGQFEFGYVGPAGPLQGLFPQEAIEATEKVVIPTGPMPTGRREKLVSLMRNRILSRFTSDISFMPKASRPGIYLMAGIFFLCLFVYTYPKVSTRVEDAGQDYCFFLLTLFLLYAKGWSPQFAVLPVAMTLAAFPTPRGGLAALGFVILGVLEMPVWTYYIRAGPAGPAVISIIALVRVLYLAGLAWRLYARSRTNV